MTEEEYFRKNYPDSCYGDKPLSPHWDFFQDGVEFGERQSEKKIEELENENKTVSRKANEAIANNLLITAKYNEVLNDLNQENDKLQKENAELKAQLENDRDLPAIAYMQGAEKQKKKDEEELKKWKDEWQEQVQKATDEGYARTLQTMRLSKAKELLAKWVELFRPKLEGYPITPIQKQTEQFLSEVEK